MAAYWSSKGRRRCLGGSCIAPSDTDSSGIEQRSHNFLIELAVTRAATSLNAFKPRKATWLTGQLHAEGRFPSKSVTHSTVCAHFCGDGTFDRARSTPAPSHEVSCRAKPVAISPALAPGRFPSVCARDTLPQTLNTSIRSTLLRCEATPEPGRTGPRGGSSAVLLPRTSFTLGKTPSLTTFWLQPL